MLTTLRSRATIWSVVRFCTMVVACDRWGAWPAGAAPITLTRQVEFHASQSFWGPGRSSTDFFSSDTVGSSNAGVTYEARASSGNVSVDFAGALAVALEPRDPGSLTVSFAGNPAGGAIRTFLGARLRTDAYASVDLGFLGEYSARGNIFDLNYSVGLEKVFTPSLGQAVLGTSGNTTLASPGVDIGLLAAGVAANIHEDVLFFGSAIAGNVVEVNRSTGRTLTVPFLLSGGAARVPLQFNQFGTWDLTLTDLRLVNLFSTRFDMTLDPFLKLDLGFVDFSWDFEAANFNLHQTPAFGLAFGEIDALLSVPVVVTPEPASLVLVVLVAPAAWFTRGRSRMGGAGVRDQKGNTAPTAMRKASRSPASPMNARR